MADVMFETKPGVIRLNVVEVFEYYDGPVLYSAVSPTGQHYVSVWADSGATSDTWLFLPVGWERLRAIRTGAVSLYDAFRRSEEPWLYMVETTTSDAMPFGEIIPVDDVPDTMLPDPTERLDLPDDATPPGVVTNAADHAEQSNRNVIDIAMGPSDTATLLGADDLGRILHGFQDIIYSEAMPDRRGGPIPGTIREVHQLRVRGTFAASFGVRLEATASDLFDLKQADVEAVVQAVIGLLQSAKTKDTFGEYLRTNRRVRMTLSKYREFLSHLRTANTDFRISWSRPTRQTEDVELSAGDIQRAVDLLKSREEEEEPEMLIVRGELDTISKGRNRFVFVSEDNQVFRGSLSEQMSAQKFVIPAKAVAEIEEVIEINDLTGESQPVHTLMSIEYVEKGVS